METILVIIIIAVATLFGIKTLYLRIKGKRMCDCESDGCIYSSKCNEKTDKEEK